jgi:hypothetical protein
MEYFVPHYAMLNITLYSVPLQKSTNVETRNCTEVYNTVIEKERRRLRTRHNTLQRRPLKLNAQKTIKQDESI